MFTGPLLLGLSMTCLKKEPIINNSYIHIASKHKVALYRGPSYCHIDLGLSRNTQKEVVFLHICLTRAGQQ